MARQPDLFDRPPRRAPRVMMHAEDCGEFPDGKMAVFLVCPKCGHKTGWVYGDWLDMRRGRPCPVCNGDS
jgi:hypothetical protein